MDVDHPRYRRWRRAYLARNQLCELCARRKSHQTLVSNMTEDQLKAAIIDFAELHGWRVYSIRRSDLAKVQGRTGKGYPDLTLVRGGRCWAVELKDARRKVTPEQEAWLDAWEQVPGVETAVWRPEHWFDGTVDSALR